MAYEQHGGSVVPVGEEGREEALALFEQADTEAIIAHLSTGGVELEDFVYSFPIEGREVVGISWAGAKEIARQLGNIEVLREIKVEDRDGAFYGLVWVRDIARNVTILGAARQPKEKTLKSGVVKPDEHAFVVAINKAQRNGILALVDEAVKQRLVSAFLQGHKKAVKRSDAPPPLPRSASPGPTQAAFQPNPTKAEVKPQSPQDQALRDATLREIRDQIKGLAKGPIPTEASVFGWWGGHKWGYSIPLVQIIGDGPLPVEAQPEHLGAFREELRKFQAQHPVEPKVA